MKVISVISSSFYFRIDERYHNAMHFILSCVFLFTRNRILLCPSRGNDFSKEFIFNKIFLSNFQLCFTDILKTSFKGDHLDNWISSICLLSFLDV